MRRTGLGMDLPGDGHGPTWGGGWARGGKVCAMGRTPMPLLVLPN